LTRNLKNLKNTTTYCGENAQNSPFLAKTPQYIVLFLCPLFFAKVTKSPLFLTKSPLFPQNFHQKIAKAQIKVTKSPLPKIKVTTNFRQKRRGPVLYKPSK
jgi:hypothetical protein